MPIINLTNYDSTNSDDPAILNTDNLFYATKDRTKPDEPTVLISPDGTASWVKESIDQINTLIAAANKGDS